MEPKIIEVKQPSRYRWECPACEESGIRYSIAGYSTPENATKAFHAYHKACTPVTSPASRED